MRPLWLDFQRAPPGTRRTGGLVLLIGVVTSSLLLFDYFAVTAATEELTGQVVRLKRETSRQLAMASQGASTRAAVAGAGNAADLSTRWNALFDGLESAADETVTLLAVQPGAKEIKVSGEARDLAATMDYLRRLQGIALFANAYLTQSDVVREHPQRPVRFTLTAEWPQAAP